MSNDVELVGVKESWKVGSDGEVYRAYGQEFDTSFWAGLQWAREQDATQRTKDLWHVADVPAVFVEKWLREGFNIYQAPTKEIIRRLHKEELTDFMVTRKRVC